MKARIHTPRAMERITHPAQPRDVHELVSAMIWDGDRAVAYWLAEEMLTHPRVKASVHNPAAYTDETHGYWLGVWSALGDCLTKKQREAKPETTLDRERAVRERRAV